MCAAFELKLVWPILLQILVFVLLVLPEYWKLWLSSFSFSCVYASFYAIVILFYFSGSKSEQYLCRVSRTFQLGTWILITWRTKWRMWMYSYINHFTNFWCLNLCLPLTSVTRWLAFQIIQFCEGTRMNLDIQGSRCMFIILFGISLIGAMIWNLCMSKAFGFRSKQEEALLSS